MYAVLNYEGVALFVKESRYTTKILYLCRSAYPEYNKCGSVCGNRLMYLWRCCT
jgi:hypothetical protein